MNRRDRIYQCVKQHTLEIIKTNQLDHNGVDALLVSQLLKLDRANVSKELNALWKDGLLVKIQEKPILFLCIEEIKNYFSIEYLPSLICKNEVLSQFLKFDKKEIALTDAHEDTIDTMIGAKDSLAHEISKAKAALSYPPNGLHTLILGDLGVGKSTFAQSMFDYAIRHNYKKKGAKFIHVDCHNYQDLKEFKYHLLGANKGTFNNDKTRKGIIEECNEGIIFLEHIDQLNHSAIELIIDLIEKNSYTRLGDSNPLSCNCMIIASASKSVAEHEHERLFSKYFPIHIDIPTFDARNYNEKIELILTFFANEAILTKFPIRFHKDILACFISSQYKQSLTDLKNQVKLVCSKAYLDAQKNQLNTLLIGFQHLPLNMLSSEIDPIISNRVSRVLSVLKDDYILVSSNGSSDTLNFFKTSSNVYGLKRMNQFVEAFNQDIETLDNIQEYVGENLTCLNNCGNAQLSALESSISPIVMQIFEKLIWDRKTKENFNHITTSYYGLLLHVSNLIKRIENNEYVYTTSGKTYTHDLYPNEFDDATRIIHFIEDKYHIKCSNKEVEFIANYLAIANSWFTTNKVSIMIISHSNHIASAMVDYVKSLYDEDFIIEAINLPNHLQLNDLLEYVAVKAQEINQGSGIIIISDYEPLLSLSDYLRTTENIPSKTLSPLSLPMINDVIEKVIHNYSINQIVQFFDQDTNTNTHTSTSNFIEQLADRFIAPSVSFIDTNKAINLLIPILEDINAYLNIPSSKEISVKFLCHCVHMLERIIKKEPLQYPRLLPFINNNKKIFHFTEKRFKIIEETFGIKIPSDEFAYICEIHLFIK